MQIKSPLHLSFDVGHSSIGWAIICEPQGREGLPEILGCGSVIFGADDCLASARRAFRRQRRHIRSTRQRIRNLKNFFIARGILTETQLNGVASWNPFQLATDALARGRILTWPELWDVLRWYAHNRGYDGNRRWSSADDADQAEDTEKVTNARGLMAEHKKSTMAETMAAHVAKFEAAAAEHREQGTARPMRFKGLNAAFPRDTVEAECQRILEKHAGNLPGLTQEVITIIMSDAAEAKLEKLPKRYQGGLLFGQMVPRFDNRIIANCPITSGKVPTRECVEFYRFRWAMMLANIRVAEDAKGDLRPLSVAERSTLNTAMQAQGKLTPTELGAAVKALPGIVRHNLDTMLMHPDMKEALILDPVQDIISSGTVAVVWPHVPVQIQQRFKGQLRRGKSWTMSQLLADNAPALEALRDHLATKPSKAKKAVGHTIEEELQRKLDFKPLSMRAPYSREILAKVYQEVISTNTHPKEKGGVLYITEEMRAAQVTKPIENQTNNHLVRHRLKIFAGDPKAKPAPKPGLLQDLIKAYADNDPERISRVTIEVATDLRTMSGMSNKEKAKELGSKLSNFKSVVEKLEKIYPPNLIKPGLIRKARILEDLGGKCPYTGMEIDLKDLSNPEYVDKDHVIPRSERQSDSLDSLVITFKAINAWKGKRTAYRFVEQEQGNPLPGHPGITILPLSKYEENVKKLDSFRGHDDDKRRKKKRKELLLLPDYEEKEFTPGDLTKTSQLVRLAADAMKREFASVKKMPVLTSLPGAVTGTVRKSWRLMGALAQANPQVLDESGAVRTKTEIRDITHLHHALDACVIGLAEFYIGRDGSVWELLVKRKPTPAEQQTLKAKTHGLYIPGTEGRGGMLQDLPNELKAQIGKRLAECRVVQHLPKSIDGLRVEQNAWRVRKIEGENVHLEQSIRQPDGSRVKKTAIEKPGKLLGLNPDGTDAGKLQPRQSVLVIPENYGVALDPTPTIIPYHKVWNRLRDLQKANGGKRPRVIRNGNLIKIASGNYAGVWRVFSAKNNASGMALDIGRPDVVRLKNKTEGHKINVLLSSLLKAGLSLHSGGLVG